MKKINLTILSLVVSAMVFAQSPLVKLSENLRDDRFKTKTFNFYPENSASKKKAALNMVFNYSTGLTDFHGGDNVITFPVLLFPDTAIQIVARSQANTMDSVYAFEEWSERFNNGVSLFSHNVGFVFDPRSTIYSASQGGEYTQLSNFNSYTVDSFDIPYLYSRHTGQDVVDTLIVQYYNTFLYGNVTFGGSNPPEPSAFPYAYPAYSFQQNLGTGAANTIKIPLTVDDTASASLGVKTIKAGLTVQAKRKFGFTISYKPGTDWSKTVPFDTLGASTVEGVPVSKPFNEFYYLINFDQNRYFEETTTAPLADKIYNQGLLIDRGIRYNTDPNGFNGTFLPGQAVYSTVAQPVRLTPIFPEATFYVFSPNVGVKNLDKSGFGMGEVYPNPVTGNEQVNVEFNLGSSENVTLTVYDMMGKVVKTVSSGNYPGGNHLLTVDLNRLNGGVYFCTLSAGSFSSTRKFTLVK